MKNAVKFAAMLGFVAAVLAAPAFAGEAMKVVAMPEPSSLAMLVTGLGGVFALRWKLKR